MSPTKPDNDTLWVQAVEKWLAHIDGRHVENLLIAALAVQDKNPEEAAVWLRDNRYMSTIGNYSDGAPKALCIDVGTQIFGKDFMKVYWGGWDDEQWQFNVTLPQILEYLKNGKQRATQPQLFSDLNKISPQEFTD